MRSGEYKQGGGQLHKSVEGVDYWCCLGVLCDVAMKEGVDVECTHRGPLDREPKAYTYNLSDSCLPDTVRNWIDFEKMDRQDLMDKNDSGQYTFEQIADIIEKRMVKVLWLEALKSGKYKQGKGRLCKGGGESGFTHCCLGVLCELAVEHGIVEKKVTYSYGCGVAYFKAIGEDEPHWTHKVLLDEVTDWAGLSSNVGNFTDEGNKITVFVGHTSLASLNDSADNFDKVIEVIESGLPFRKEFK